MNASLRIPLALLGLALLCCSPASAKRSRDGYAPLFNGKTMKGFYTVLASHGKNNDPDHVFAVEKGAIRVSGREAGYFATEKAYDHYDLRFQILWTAPGGQGRNAGCLVCLNDPDQVWPTSIEVQGQEGSIGDFWVIGKAALTVNGVRRTGEGDRHFVRTVADNPEQPAGEWTQVDVRCDGEEILVKVNGVEVHHGVNATPTRGRIGFQSEGSEVFYRAIEIRPIKKASAKSSTK